MSESIYEFLWYVNNIMLALLQGGFLWYNLTPKFNKHLVFLITTVPFVFLVVSQKFVTFVAPSFPGSASARVLFHLRGGAIQGQVPNEGICVDSNFCVGIQLLRRCGFDVKSVWNRQQRP